MRRATGDLFAYPACALVVPVNTRTRRDGTAAMGAGVALRAARLWPALPAVLGARLLFDGPGTYAIRAAGMPRPVVCLPTKRHWRETADVNLIAEGVRTLTLLADLWAWRTVALPRLGAGLGGLSWARVAPVLDGLLDDRFVCIERPAP